VSEKERNIGSGKRQRRGEVINSIGHTGGFFGPSVVGYLNDRTGKATAAFWLIGICYLMAGGLFSRIKVQNPQQSAATELRAHVGLATES